jgi:hypothetical protein
MRVLLDTNILSHREASTAVKEEIGLLFRWLDDLGYTKCVHPVSVAEIARHGNAKTPRTMGSKLGSYHELKTEAPLADQVAALSAEIDRTENERNGSRIINELYCERVDALVTEDRNLRCKAEALGITERVFSIDGFLEKVAAENPDFVDYKVLAVRRQLFGEINVANPFFDSFWEDYPEFEKWFNRKSDETAYVCHSDGNLLAFLYLKTEGKTENYSAIIPPFAPARRLKIGTFKVALNGYRLGERFLKIAFDNALCKGVDEIYVTIFDRRMEQTRLISLLSDYGFFRHGDNQRGEQVFVRSFRREASRAQPRTTYPFCSSKADIYIVPIYPEYHTELFPDSILRTESPADFVENEPHRNAISKTYICRSIERGLVSGDVIVFYRTGGYFKSVVTTIGIVESVIQNIPSEAEFIALCRKRTVFTDAELSKHWNYNQNNRPFIVNFLYAYSLPKRINMKRLIELGVIPDIESAPRGFTRITLQNLRDILKESQSDEGIVVD